ncbi:zinc-binding dehydrogenase [Sphingomonas sp. NBWT7]|uniref:zinc-binding dehydrogenase n=1 Tax=Sphingomonas sp. NBWT7 TaxID=2596913 RepID=UPI0016257E2B|nr:zinc-binding dehydrogenase [Sphingomonas sp. NBWT7]
MTSRVKVSSVGATSDDYRNEDFTQRLHDYDVVLTSREPNVLERSLKVLRPGGKLISLSGPTDPAFGQSVGANWAVRQIMRLMSSRFRRLARQHGIEYCLLFMRAGRAQLAKIAAFDESGAIRPVLDRIRPFVRTSEILSLIDDTRGPGKVVVSRDLDPYSVDDLLTKPRSVSRIKRDVSTS